MPLQFFQWLMMLFFKSLSRSHGEEVQNVDEFPRKAPSVYPTVQDDFWIDSLTKMLPGTWVQEGVILDKAAKADDAKIHRGLWDQCVTLVLPAVT